MKTLKLAGVLLLVVGLLVAAVGCYEQSKTTGGGWFYDEVTSAKVTFGFNAQPTEVEIIDDEPIYMAKGKFALVDHSTKPPTRIHGTIFFQSYPIELPEGKSNFWGFGSVDGELEYLLIGYFEDNGQPGADPGDYISAALWDGVSVPALVYGGTLEGGNIKVHKVKD